MFSKDNVDCANLIWWFTNHDWQLICWFYF